MDKSRFVVWGAGSLIALAVGCGGQVGEGPADPETASGGGAGTTAASGAAGSTTAAGAGGTAGNAAGGASPNVTTPVIIPPKGLTFTNDVAPIFDHSCALAGCHSPESYIGLLLGPSKQFPAPVVLSNIVDKTTYLGVLVRPGAPDDSVLLRKVEGNFTGLACDVEGGCGGPMPPKSKGPLTATEIGIIRQWIAEGATELVVVS